MSWYRLAWPLLSALNPEFAHRLAIRALRRWPLRRPRKDDPVLAIRVAGIDFPNPVGLAAGFDKHGEVFAPLAALGFGFVECGSVTPRPQPGNAKPRVFRLTEDRAVINRYGFNSVGLDAFALNLAAGLARAPEWALAVPLGINLGKNKDSAGGAADFARGAAQLGGLGQYMVVNVSSPNTPGLRALQGKSELTQIAAAVRTALRPAAVADRTEAPRKPPPLFLKIAPDLAEADLADIAAVAGDGAFDGVIVSNTTLARPDTLQSRHKHQAGGLSGAPLKPLALAALSGLHRLTEGKVPLIAAGGIESGADAYARIRAGASLVQLYTALIYEGPGLVARMKRDLAALLRRDGFAALAEAVGAAAPNR